MIAMKWVMEYLFRLSQDQAHFVEIVEKSLKKNY